MVDSHAGGRRTIAGRMRDEVKRTRLCRTGLVGRGVQIEGFIVEMILLFRSFLREDALADCCRELRVVVPKPGVPGTLAISLQRCDGRL